MDDVQTKQEGQEPEENLDEKVGEEIIDEKSEDEIRSEIIEKHDLDEVEDDSLIEQLLAENLDTRKKLLTAIKQKIGYRDKVKALEKQIPIPQKSSETRSINKDEVAKLVIEQLNERDLASAEIDDKIKTEVKAYDKAKGVDYKAALSSDYIKFLQNQAASEEKTEKASIGNSRKTVTAKQNFNDMKPEEVKGMDSESFKQYMNWLKSQG